MSRFHVSVWILPDQLLAEHPALARAEQEFGRERVRVLLVESDRWLRQLRYHRKRQILILSAGRHYAQELTEAGYQVEVVRAADGPTALEAHLRRHGSRRLVMMEAADFAIRSWQETRRSEQGKPELTLLPNTQYLVGQFNPIPNPQPDRRYIMENFYRAMRQHFQVLIEPDGRPTGGRWNYDAENRKPLPPGLIPPEVPAFEPDSITRKVIEEVDAADHGVGTSRDFDLAVTRAQAAVAFDDFLEHRLPLFGPYEDAMSRRHGTLFHSVLSPYLNLGLLEPLPLVRSAEQAYRSGQAPLNSVEGFVRQLLGWREFIYWQYWRQMPDLRTANHWGATRPLPSFFWDAQTDMSCLRHIVERLIAKGFAHHIERLMVVCNYCLLAGINPALVADWFLEFYIDSHEWVVLPNVIGMGLNADGGQTATKPYIASAAYIHRMSDYCTGCRYSPRQRTGPEACPFNLLYWNFLLEHETELRSNPRLGPNVLGLRHLSPAERHAIQEQARTYLSSLPQSTP